MNRTHDLTARRRRLAAVASGLALASVAAPPLGAAPTGYAENLELIRSASPRNANHDGSPWRSTPQSALELSNHLGPRSDYLPRTDVGPPFWPGKEHPGGTPELSFPVVEGGQFRIACEFSHFAYDDPIVAPGEPGGSHLHMFFGNTDVNAYSTYDTLANSGSSTCNGQEINRTGYWMPALFDAAGDVRIPMRAIVYYKGYGLANGASEVYPPGAAIIAKPDLHTVPDTQGGVAPFEKAIDCSDQFRGPRAPASNTMPTCSGGDGTGFFRTIELHVKFPNCWNREDPSNPDNWRTSLEGGWFYSSCLGWATTPNIEYIVQYQLDPGESTAGWYLASDVNRETLTLDVPGGSTLHGDWWGGWREDVNRAWLDGCVNFSVPGVPSGCGFGYLSDGGPDGNDPLPGPALKLRPQYDRPETGAPKVAASTLHEQLCPDGARISAPEEAAWCTAASSEPTPEPGDPAPTPVDPAPAPLDPAPTGPSLPAGTGLVGRYFDDRHYALPVGERADGPLDVDLNRALPDGSNLTDARDVSIEWSGYLVADVSGEAELWTRSDDGVRVYLDGELVIDEWTTERDATRGHRHRDASRPAGRTPSRCCTGRATATRRCSSAGAWATGRGG